MFTLTNDQIDVSALHGAMEDARAGAVVTFEGKVRNHNDGRTVTTLEYEAYPALALKEGERILAGARQRFDVYDCHCVHRTGSLQIGDVAVWVGVLAAHRGEAFDACRFIIDEVKQSVPIWKKETYDQGDSGWVNCTHTAHTLDHANEHEHEQGPGSGGRKPASIANAEMELDILDMSGSDLASYEIVDIREPGEDPVGILRALLRRDVATMPLSRLDATNPPLEPNKRYLLVCQRGASSAKLAADLRQRGFNNVYCLAGGVEAVRRKYIA
jgi:molybdopterin synthase catalytic subunit/rhodanese-related sulfurtransferase